MKFTFNHDQLLTMLINPLPILQNVFLLLGQLINRHLCLSQESIEVHYSGPFLCIYSVCRFKSLFHLLTNQRLCKVICNFALLTVLSRRRTADSCTIVICGMIGNANQIRVAYILPIPNFPLLSQHCFKSSLLVPLLHLDSHLVHITFLERVFVVGFILLGQLNRFWNPQLLASFGRFSRLLFPRRIFTFSRTSHS